MVEISFVLDVIVNGAAGIKGWVNVRVQMDGAVVWGPAQLSRAVDVGTVEGHNSSAHAITFSTPASPGSHSVTLQAEKAGDVGSTVTASAAEKSIVLREFKK
jgi:hypothetical protein